MELKQICKNEDTLEMMYCVECNKELGYCLAWSGDTYCPKCGVNKENQELKKKLEDYKKKEVKWLQSILDTKHIEENSRWIIEGRLRNLKEVKSK